MSKIAVIGLSGESIFLKLNNLPTPSVTSHAKSCHIEPGGKGYNQAVACKKNGSIVTYLSKIGSDAYGKYCKEYMDNLGIINKFIIDESNKTAVATILTSDDGENEVIVYPGASSDLTKEDVLLFKDEIISSDILLVQYEIGYEALCTAIDIAKENNVIIILNPAPAIYQDLDLLNKASIVTPNKEEAKVLYNIPDSLDICEYGKYLQDKVDNILIITLGKDGCLLVNNHKYQYFNTIKVESVDTTGAGDTFNAGLASMLNKNFNEKDLEQAIKYGLAAASLSVTKPYVMDAIPNIDEVNKFQQLFNLKEKK